MASGVGLVPGAIITGIGAAVGGVGAWLNRDSLTAQTARAMEVTDRAKERYDGMAAFSTGVREYGGVGLRFIAPTSNLVQGLEDVRLGKGGDGRAEFYEMDGDGKRVRSNWMQAADYAATVVDSIGQFGTKLGVRAYMGLTAAHASGQLGAIATTGAVWDDRRADFNELNGGKEWGSALGSVGIDVVQLGMAGAIAKAGAAGRAAFSTTAAGEAAVPGRLGQAMAAAKERLTPWAAKSTEGTTTSIVNGMKFTVDKETGRALSARATWTLMAPSEMLRWVPTSMRARARTAAGAGAPTYDDFYRAALELAGGNRFSAAIVNGWAEGGEEAIQAVLDPWSVSAGIDVSQVADAAMYGAAAGAGMSLGHISRPPANEQVQKWRAKALYMRRNAVPNMTEAEWNDVYGAMSKGQRQRAAEMTPEEEVEIADTLRMMQEAQTPDRTRRSTIGAVAWMDMQKSAWARDLASVNPAVDGSLVLAGLAGAHIVTADGRIEADVFPANTGATTAWQAVDNIIQTHDGLQVQADDLRTRVAAADKALAVATESGDADAIAAAQQKVDLLATEIDDTVGLMQISEQIRDRMLGMYNVLRDIDPADVVAAEAATDEINAFLREAYTGELKDETGALLDARTQEFARRSVELRVGRHPFIDKGSFLLLMPQISKALTESGAHGTVAVNQATLKALAGDHDGDFMVRLNTSYLPQEQLDAFRRGDQYLEPVEGGVKLTMDAPDGEKELVSLLSGALVSSDQAVYGNAAFQLEVLKAELYERYTGVVEENVLIEALNDLHQEVRDNNPEARTNLATKLFNANTQGMLNVGSPTEPEPLWLWARITRAWDTAQKMIAANDAELQETPASVNAPLRGDRAFQAGLAQEEAANDAQTLSTLTAGTSPVRDSQHVHYALWRAAVDALGMEKGGYNPELLNDFIEQFAELGSGMTQSELDRIRGRNSTQKRVVVWLERISREARDVLGVDSAEALLLIANTQVADINIIGPNDYEVAEGDVSLLQLLLKKSIEIERVEHRKAPEDSDIVRKLRSLERLTRRDTRDAGKSHTAQLALMEVFGGTQLHRLLGDSSKYLGPQLTLNQLLESITNVSDEVRNKITHRWKRWPPYALHAKIGNPPYSAQEAASGTLHGYKVLVDAVIAAANKAPRQREEADARADKDLVDGFTWIKSMIQSYRQMHSKQLKKTDDIDVLRVMLENNLDLAASIASIIPDAAKAGAFQMIDGQVYAAPWVEQMLVEPDSDKAAVSYIVNSHFAEWNAMGGNIDERGTDPVTGQEEPHTHPRNYDRIKSRFNQTLYHLARQPDGFEFNRFLLTARSATSPADLMEKINNEPGWLMGRAELYAFYDDVASFESDPSEVWTANLPGTLQREALKKFSTRMSVMSSVMGDYATMLETEKPLLANMRTVLNGGTDHDNASKYVGLLEAAITNRKMFPDATGRGAREQLTAILQTGILRMQDKGKADPAIAPFGEPLVTMDEFGVKLSVFQELDAMTSLDPEDIRSNLTKLVEGPVRVGLADGSTAMVDLSTTEGALAALENPALNAFAKAVLFPTTRDIDNNNVLQMYQDVTSVSLKTMLEEQTFHHLFPKSGRLTPEQAHRLLNTVEAGVRKAALTGTEEEQERAFFPLQQIINEALVAYTHRPGSETADQKKIRDDVFVDTAEALIAFASLPSGEQTEEAVALMKAVLRKRFLRDSSALAAMFQDQFAAAAADVMLTDATAIAYQRMSASITAQLADPNLTQDERDALNLQLDRVNDQVTEYLDRMKPFESDNVVDSVINMFTLTGDPLVDLERKNQIVQTLGARNRVGKFQGNYRLATKINQLLGEDPLNAIDDSAISAEEWNEAALWAASAYIAETAGRSGSSITLTPLVLGKEGEQVRRFFDPTYSYLLDGLLNEQVLSVTRFLMHQALYDPDVEPDSVVQTLENGLLNEKKLGPWTDRVVYQSLVARQALSQSSVGLAIPVAGDAPKDVADYVGAGWNLTQLPSTDMLTTDVTFRVDTMNGAVVLGATPEEIGHQFLKLNNHFAGRVVLKGMTANGDLEIDLMPKVGEEWWGDYSVRDSGYKVISVERINEAVARALDENDFVGDPALVVDYFDVDTKPFAREWANNVYFDGVGRGGATSTGPGPVAELTFAPGALSKTGQQNPLDMATKGGKGYKATPVSPFATTVNLESSGASVAEILGAKALHMLSKEYDTGFLLSGDSTALHKLMKQRHVVVGLDDQGEKVVWWAEQAIAAQTAGEPLPANAKLVALSDSQAQTLLGKAGEKGLDVVSMPVFNLVDVDPFPSLDVDRLAELGMTRLGEESSLLDSPFAGMMPLPQARWSEERGKGRVSRYEERIQRWRGEQFKWRSKRTQVAKTGEANYDILRINDEAGKLLEKMLSTEALAPVLARLKIPFPSMTDLNELNISKVLKEKLQALASVSPSSVIWQYRHGQSSDPASGVLGAHALENDFRDMGKIPPPIFEDVVLVDLADIVKKTSNPEQAYKLGKSVVRAFARRGVTIVLGASEGSALNLRNDLAEYLREGGDGYAAMAESTHFFAPINEDYRVNQTQRALDSTLIEARPMVANGIVARFLSDRFVGANENATHLDLRPDTRRWRAVGLTLLPTQLIATAGGHKFTYGLPVKGTGQFDQEAQVRDALLPILKSPEGRAHLKRVGGGDPKGVRVYRENANGTIDPGIRSFDDALDVLQATLEANDTPIAVGNTLMMGDLIPVLGSDNSILLIRAGFKLPNVVQLNDQLRTPFGGTKPTPGEIGAKIGVAVDEIQAEWTVKPPFTIEKVSDDRNGIAIEGKYDLSPLGKGVLQGDGFKDGFIPMPNDLAAPDAPMSGNGLRITEFGSRKASEGKAATAGQVTDFRWLNALAGFDIRNDLVEFFMGKKNRDDDEFKNDWAKVNTFLKQWAKRKSGDSATQIAEMLDQNTFLATMRTELNALGGGIFGNGFVFKGSDMPTERQTDPQNRLAQIVLATLMAPRIKPEHIISTSGILSLDKIDDRRQIMLMPQLFTDSLKDVNYPELEKMLIDRANSRMPRNADGQRIYELGYDWQFRVRMQNPLTGKDELVPGVLQLSLTLPADENPVNYTQASVRSTRKTESQHVGFVFGETAGGRIALERPMRNVERLFSDKGIERFDSPADGGFWSLLHALPKAKDDNSYKPWRQLAPLQRLYSMEADKKVRRYTEPVKKNAKSGWTEGDRTRIMAKVDTLLRQMNMKADARVEVDYLVRQFFGKPAAAEGQDPEIGRISPAIYDQAVELMLTNVSKNRVPTYGGIVPLPHAVFLAMAYEAQQGAAKPWAPALTPKKRSKLAGSWDEWVFATYGQMRESNEEFHSMFRMDLDGFHHTYQGVNADFVTQATSTDPVVDLKLMDKEANQHLISLDPNKEVLLAEPIILDTSKATLDALVGYDPVVAAEHSREVPTSDLAKQIEHQVSWLAGKKLPKQKKAPMRSYLEEGARYQESSRDTHNLFHSMVNLSIISRLANPALWASAIIEVPIRNSMEHAVNLLQGRATGVTGRALTRAGEAVGMTPRYTEDDMRKLKLAAETLGSSNEFLAEIYDQLTYHSLVEVGHNKIGKGLERGASLVARTTSDPRFGMLAKSVAMRYLEAAMEYIDATDNSITLDQLVAKIAGGDVLYLKKHFSTERFSPHQAGLNRIAQVRSIKATVPAKILMGSIDSLTSNPAFAANLTGHLLKIPFLFTRFNTNAVITMMGLGGFDQMAAMFLDGRRNPTLGKMKAAMQGIEYDPAEHDPIDMSDVIEGYDLMRPFMRGAMTQTGLMALGMMAGGLGLGGDDDEARRRKRLATQLGTPVYYDMREAQNDFRYADAIFLDSIPGLSAIFQDATGRSAVMPHWIMRQFLAPVMGIERFFSTGDVRQIKWGFAEAYSVIPTTVTRLWRDADMTADMLAESAKETEGPGTPEARAATSSLLLNIVGVYERALIESSFANALRSGGDKYNRNPWIIPETTADGTIVRDRMGNPEGTKAMDSFINEDGEIQQGYSTREAGGLEGALTHQYAENNATAAILMSLFTGQWSGESSFLRENMAVSTKKVELKPPSRQSAEALVLMALKGSDAGGPAFTADEIGRKLKHQIEAAGGWWKQEEIDAQAQAIFNAHADKKAALSLLDEKGREIVTEAGADGIFRSLAKGGIELGDESLRGVFIPFEMRRNIERQWVAELIQEGVDFGLNNEEAKYRAKRIWFGNNFDAPTNDIGGLRGLLWSKEIPMGGKVTYNQLNTTYAIGPDGRPWATPFKRTNALQAFGLPIPHGTHDGGKGGLTVDARGNIVDSVLGINTGLAALERVDESWTIEPPEAKELDDLFNKNYTAGDDGTDGGGNGWKNFGKSGWKNYGGGGGGGGGYFSKMYSMPHNISPYGNDTPFINTSNPILRRAFVRRERVSSERGRLNQWQ